MCKTGYALSGVVLGFVAPLLLCFPAQAEEATSMINQIDSGNTAWLLASSALVMLMTPGLAFFYAGSVSRKNVVSTLLQNYVALALVGIIWITIGFSLVFTESNPFIGSFDWVMLNGLEGKVLLGPNVPYMAFVAFQMMFAVITPALITGAIAERVNFKAWIIILSLWSLLVYCPVAHWVWGPDGWIEKMGGLDFAGGLVVHITSGCAGLVAATMFGKRYKTAYSTPNDVPMIMLGTALLWFGWFGFNGGAALVAGSTASHAFITSFAGGATAFLAWMIVDNLRGQKLNAVGSATGIIAGLVCITPAAGYVSIEAAMFMCAISGAVCNLVSYQMKKASRLDDALDVFACHGVGGIIGSVLTGVFASKAINPAIQYEGIAINGDGHLLMANISGVLAVAVYTVVMTFAITKLVNLFVRISVSQEDQQQGLDLTQHGEQAKNTNKLTAKS